MAMPPPTSIRRPSLGDVPEEPHEAREQLRGIEKRRIERRGIQHVLQENAAEQRPDLGTRRGGVRHSHLSSSV